MVSLKEDDGPRYQQRLVTGMFSALGSVNALVAWLLSRFSQAPCRKILIGIGRKLIKWLCFWDCIWKFNYME